MSTPKAAPPLMLRARRIAGAAKHWLFPTPEVAAWRHACRRAEGVPRFTEGRIRLMQYDLRYTDLLSSEAHTCR